MLLFFVVVLIMIPVAYISMLLLSAMYDAGSGRVERRRSLRPPGEVPAEESWRYWDWKVEASPEGGGQSVAGEEVLPRAGKIRTRL
jgi:hypothetical protein